MQSAAPLVLSVYDQNDSPRMSIEPLITDETKDSYNRRMARRCSTQLQAASARQPSGSTITHPARKRAAYCQSPKLRQRDCKQHLRGNLMDIYTCTSATAMLHSRGKPRTDTCSFPSILTRQARKHISLVRHTQQNMHNSSEHKLHTLVLQTC